MLGGGITDANLAQGNHKSHKLSKVGNRDPAPQQQGTESRSYIYVYERPQEHEVGNARKRCQCNRELGSPCCASESAPDDSERRRYDEEKVQTTKYRVGVTPRERQAEVRAYITAVSDSTAMSVRIMAGFQ